MAAPKSARLGRVTKPDAKSFAIVARASRASRPIALKVSSDPAVAPSMRMLRRHFASTAGNSLL
jgi:hypothetical protein